MCNDTKFQFFEKSFEKYQTKLETAKSFLAEGLTPQVVARCTGLPIERVMELSTITDRLKEE